MNVNPIPPDQSNSPFSTPAKQFQFGMGTLLIAMALFAVTSAALVFASQLPLVTNEIHAWMGTVPSTNLDGTDRFTQLIFLLFCYSTPLLMTAVLSWVSFAADRWTQVKQPRITDSDQDFEME